MVLRRWIAIIGLAMWLAMPVPVDGQRPKDIEMRTDGLMVFADGMALSYHVRNKAKKPVWVMFEVDGPPTGNTCRAIRKLGPQSARFFQCPQPTIAPGAVYTLAVAVYATERFGTLLTWFNGSMQLTEGDLESIRKSTQDKGISAPMPAADSADDAGPSPPLPAVFDGTAFRVPPDLSTAGKRLKSGLGSMFSLNPEMGSFTVEAGALLFKSDKRTLRIPFSSITSVGLATFEPPDHEWLVVRFVGDDQQPAAAAFFNGGGKKRLGDTGTMLLTIHRARR